MGLRDRLGSPWLTAALTVAALALVAALAVASGLVTPPHVDLGFFSYQTFAPIAVASPSPSPTPAEATFAYPTPSPQATFISYVVQPGDTLTSIAKRFRTTGRSIAWWNRGTYPSLDPESPSYAPNSIKKGWVLVVLPGTVVDENNPPTPSPAPSTPAPVLPSAAPASS